MAFWTNYLKGKGKALNKEMKMLAAEADMEGYTEAAIQTQMDRVNAFVNDQAKAEINLTKEKKDVEEILQLQKDRLAGISILQEDIANTTDPAEIARLTSIVEAEVTKLEEMQEDIAREKEEAAEAESDLAEIRELLSMEKEKLDTMRGTLNKTKSAIERANRAEERAKAKADLAAKKAGFAEDNTFDDLLGAAKDRLAEIEQRTRATTIKAELLSDSKGTSSDMQDAIARAKGKVPTSTMSVAERLAAIKSGK